MAYTPPTFKGSGAFSPYVRSAASTGLTPFQKIELAYLQGQQHPHHGLLGTIFHDATHGVSAALDFISRPSHAIATGADVAVRGGDTGAVLHGAKLGIEGKSHVGFGQVLGDAGLIQGHRKLRGLAGFGLDVVTDPVMLASIAAAPVTGGSSLSLIAEREAAMGLEKGALSRAASTVLEGTTRKFSDVEAARNLLREAGPGFEFQAGLGNVRLARLDRPVLPISTHAGRQANDDLIAHVAGANEEHQAALGARYLHAKYRIPFGKSLGMDQPYVGFNTHIRAPNLKAIAGTKVLERVPVLKHIPGAAEQIGKAFKPNWDNESFHAMKMVGIRITEHLSDQNVEYMRKALKEFTGGNTTLSRDEIYHALDWGETNAGIVNGADRKFNVSMARRAVKSGDLSKKQAQFLSAWHSVTEHMRLQDQAYGLHYDKPLKDVVYVPHIYTTSGGTINNAANMLTKPGFEYARLHYKAQSVKGLKELYDSGAYRRSVETDPQKLMAIRMRRGAKGAAESTVRTAIAASTGVPTYVVDAAKLGKRAADKGTRIQKLEEVTKRLHSIDAQKVEARTIAHNKWAERLSKESKKTREAMRMHKRKIKALKRQIKDFHLEFKGTPLHKVAQPNPLLYKLAREEKAMATTQSRWIKSYQKIQTQLEKETARRLHSIDERANSDFNRFVAHNKAIDRLDRQMVPNYKRNRGLFKKNPAAFAHDMVVEPKLRSENGGSIAIPASMSQALSRIAGTETNDEFLTEFRSTWQKLMAKWKLGATVVNPGYRVRNTMSDLWNMYSKPENHVPLWAMLKYGTKAAALVKAARDGDPTAARTLIEAFDHGILAGLFQGDIERVIKYTSKQGTAKELASKGKLLAAGTKAATTFNRHAENWGRLTHYLYLKDHLDMTAVNGARDVRATHFDYEDLTPTERVLKSNFIPFYTWTRKNIPRQISSYLQAPGRYATFPKFVNESEYASGDNTKQIVPDWMKGQLAFHVPFGGKGNMMVPAFGPTDPAKLQNPTQLLGMLSPLLKMPAELAFNKNLLTGAPIYGSDSVHPRAPVSTLGKDLFRFLPGGNVGQTSRNVGGKPLYGAGANPVYSYLASVLPLANVAVNQTSNIRTAQRGPSKAWLSEIGGISTFQPDQAAQATILQQKESAAFKSFIKGLRDSQKIKQPKHKKSTPYQTRQAALLKSLNQ